MRPDPFWRKTLCVASAVALLAACTSTQSSVDPQQERARSDLRMLSGALTQFRKERGRWPNNGEGLKALVERPGNASSRSQPVLQALPLDPWGHRYQYRFNPALDRVSIWSFGEDIVNSADDLRVDRRADGIR
jgi:general secretion pathway protein G